MALSALKTPESVPAQDLWAETVPIKIWAASTAYLVGDVIRTSAQTGNYYMCTVAGTSNATAPTWLTTGATVSDSGVTWQYFGVGNGGDLVRMPNGLVAYIVGLQPLDLQNLITFGYVGCIAVSKASGTAFTNGSAVFWNIATSLAVTSQPTYGFYVGTARGYWGSGSTIVNTMLNGSYSILNSTAITFTGATGVNVLTIPTNLADALSVVDSAGDLIVFRTTTGSQSISITPAVNVTGLVTLSGGLTGGVDGTGIDVILYGDTVGASSIFDYSTDGWLNTNSTIQFKYGTSAAVSDNGLLIGGGTDSYPCLTATADKKFIELRCKTTASSGDNRLAYLRYNIGGAGGGECLRAVTQLSHSTGTAHGAHLTLEALATGYVTGLGAGCRGQLYVQGILPAGGTYYGTMAEMYFDATGTVAAVTEAAILAVQANGDATGVATCKNAISFVGGAGSGAGNMISVGTSMSTVVGTIRILINGSVAYLPYYGHEGHA